MKRMGMILLVAAIALVSLSRTQAADDKIKDEKRGEEVKKLDAKLSEAIVKGDTALLERHTADDYMVIDATGHVWNRKQNLEALSNKTLTYDSIKDSDVKVHFYGDAAVVTGISDVKGKMKMHDLSGDYRYTRVYILRDGRWQCVSEQFTHVFEAKKK
jgi:ketosteroid isomerase-like protein